MRVSSVWVWLAACGIGCTEASTSAPVVVPAGSSGVVVPSGPSRAGDPDGVAEPSGGSVPSGDLVVEVGRRELVPGTGAPVDELRLPLPDGSETVWYRESAERHPVGTAGWVGRTPDDVFGMLVIASDAELATIYLVHHGARFLGYARPGEEVLWGAVQSEDLDGDEVVESLPSTPVGAQRPDPGSAGGHLPSDPGATPHPGDAEGQGGTAVLGMQGADYGQRHEPRAGASEADIVFAYTTLAWNELQDAVTPRDPFGDPLAPPPDDEVDQWMVVLASGHTAVTNAIMSRSRVAAALRLVDVRHLGVDETLEFDTDDDATDLCEVRANLARGYDDPTSFLSDVPGRLAYSTVEGWASVTTGADLVGLLIGTADPELREDLWGNTAGCASRRGSPGSNPTGGRVAFVALWGEDEVVAHEIGHLYGAAHGPDNDNGTTPDPGTYAYYGPPINGHDGFYTIMGKDKLFNPDPNDLRMCCENDDAPADCAPSCMYRCGADPDEGEACIRVPLYSSLDFEIEWPAGTGSFLPVGKDAPTDESAYQSTVMTGYADDIAAHDVSPVPDLLDGSISIASASPVNGGLQLSFDCPPPPLPINRFEVYRERFGEDGAFMRSSLLVAADVDAVGTVDATACQNGLFVPTTGTPLSVRMWTEHVDFEWVYTLYAIRPADAWVACEGHAPDPALVDGPLGPSLQIRGSADEDDYRYDACQVEGLTTSVCTLSGTEATCDVKRATEVDGPDVATEITALTPADSSGPFDFYVFGKVTWPEGTETRENRFCCVLRDDTLGLSDLRVIGGPNHDEIRLSLGQDRVQCHPSQDVHLDVFVNGQGGADTIYASSQGGSCYAEDLHGGPGNDLIVALSGADEVSGEDGDDILVAGRGADDVWGNAGEDWIFGGVGNDDLYGGTEFDFLDGEEGADELWGHAGPDDLWGGEGNDVLWGGDDGDDMWGEDGDDDLDGGDGDDDLDGGVGNDELIGGDGDDDLLGGDGADDLSGGWNEDVLRGGNGNDDLQGGLDQDQLLGDAGSDMICDDASDDLFDGGSGDDFMVWFPGIWNLPPTSITTKPTSATGGADDDRCQENGLGDWAGSCLEVPTSSPDWTSRTCLPP